MCDNHEACAGYARDDFIIAFSFESLANLFSENLNAYHPWVAACYKLLLLEC